MPTEYENVRQKKIEMFDKIAKRRRDILKSFYDEGKKLILRDFRFTYQ